MDGVALAVAGAFNVVVVLFFLLTTPGNDATGTLLSFTYALPQLLAGLALLGVLVPAAWVPWGILVTVASNLASLARNGFGGSVGFLLPNAVEMVGLALVAYAYRPRAAGRGSRVGFAALALAYLGYSGYGLGGTMPSWLAAGNAVVAVAAAVAAVARPEDEAPVPAADTAQE